MKITAQIVLQEIKGGRTDNWIPKKVPTDYFLRLEIVNIEDETITTCKSAFDVLKESFPSIKIGEEEIINTFIPPILPRGADDVFHITLGNFPDFRYERNLENE